MRRCCAGRRPRLREDGNDAGSAIIEFVFVAVVVMVPLIYLIAAVATVQRAAAGRHPGRARRRPRVRHQRHPGAGRGAGPSAAVRLALADQGLPDDATVRFVAGRAPAARPRR